MEALQWAHENLSISGSPEFFRLCIFLLLVACVVLLKGTADEVKQAKKLFEEKIDSLPCRKGDTSQLEWMNKQDPNSCPNPYEPIKNQGKE